MGKSMNLLDHIGSVKTDRLYQLGGGIITTSNLNVMAGSSNNDALSGYSETAMLSPTIKRVKLPAFAVRPHKSLPTLEDPSTSKDIVVDESVHNSSHLITSLSQQSMPPT